MDSSKMERLFWQIFKCNGENDLHKLIVKNEYLKNTDNWYPYGGKNFYPLPITIKPILPLCKVNIILGSIGCGYVLR